MIKGTNLTVLLKPKFKHLLIRNTCCVFPLVAHRGIEPLFSHRKCGVLPLDECAIKERCCVGGVNLSPTLAQTRRGKHVCLEGYDFPHLIYFGAFRSTPFLTSFCSVSEAQTRNLHLEGVAA